MGSAAMVMMWLVTGCDQSTSVALFGNRLTVLWSALGSPMPIAIFGIMSK
jgi:hypothetical protein